MRILLAVAVTIAGLDAGAVEKGGAAVRYSGNVARSEVRLRQMTDVLKGKQAFVLGKTPAGKTLLLLRDASGRPALGVARPLGPRTIGGAILQKAARRFGIPQVLRLQRAPRAIGEGDLDGVSRADLARSWKDAFRRFSERGSRAAVRYEIQYGPADQPP